MKMNQSMLYMRYLSLVVLLLVSFVSFGQAPSNYTNINGRYRWIAGMFDSTFHIPKGSNPSLRTGGSTNAGALFYKTGDSSLYIYTGTQWLKIAGAAGFVPYSGATQNVNLGIYDILAKSATIADTGGTAATITQRTSINTDIALYTKAVGNRGFAAIIEQADSNATGTQYQTIFRKSMMPGTGNPAPGAGVSWYTQISNDNNNNPAVSVYRARIIDSTGYASGLIRQTSTEFWTRKNNVWDTTLVLNGGNVGINTGQNGIDSALTVANGTWFKRGVRMSALPTGVGIKALRIDANGNVSTTDTTATTGYVPYTGATQDLDMGTFSVNAKSFHIKGTAGQGHLGLKHQTATPSVSANESGVYADVNGDLGLKNDNLYTSIFKTSLNTADRTYTFQNKSYTVGDSADIAARVKYTDTASMLSPYLRSNVAAATYVPQTRTITINGTSQDLSANRTYNVGTVTSVATNTGTGITGGTITSSGTIAADTLLLSTRAWRQKGVDSVASLINTRISGTTNYIPKFTSSSAIGNSGIFTDSGSNLYFKTASTSTIGFQNNSGTQIQRIFYDDSDGSLNVGGSTALGYPIKFYTGISERMRLDASGNLLVATTSPSYNAAGRGNITIGGSSTSILSFQTGGTDRAYLYHDATNLNINNAANGALLFGTNNSTKATLDASGNLGLGVTPSAWSGGKAIQVKNSSNPIFISETNGDGWFGYNAYYNGTNWTYVGSYYANAIKMADGNFAFMSAPSGTAGTAISFTQAMTLDASGRLGIATTSPGYRLEVNGDIGFSGGASLKWGGNTYIYGSNNVQLEARVNGNLGWYINSSGNVGISTTSPNRVLDVNGVIRTQNAGSAGAPSIELGTSAQGNGLFYPTTNTIAITTNDTERMRITSGGDVVVGATSNPYTVANRGSIFLNGATESLYGWGVGGAGKGYLYHNGTSVYIENSNSGGNFNLFQVGAGNFTFNTNGSERMRITSGGELLIGTTSDAGDYKLQVNGNSYVNGDFTSTGTLYLSTNNSYLRVRNAANSAYIATIGVNTSNKVQVDPDNNGTEFGGSIKTAAPSGGTAKPYKWGEAGVAIGGSNGYAVKVEIDGTLYYLMTGYLPEPEPEPSAGPSMGYKTMFEQPTIKIKTESQEIKDLKKEIEELKQLIKNK